LKSKKDFSPCVICGRKQEQPVKDDGTCPSCRIVVQYMQEQPKTVKALWLQYQNEPILPEKEVITPIDSEVELPEVLDGKRYRAIDRDRNKWYLSVSEVNGKPVEVFASTAFDRDHELQSRISNLTTITRLISLILRHIFLGEPLTFNKCLKQIQRSSRQKNDLPDMLYGVLSRYNTPQE
jgi:DNA-directed RNA polymerase subunit RPC12/RpoP